MTSPTRQQIITAYEALETLCARAGKETNSALKIHVLSALPPKPRPTMADVEWEDDKHYLAGATSEIGDRERVMLAEAEDMIVTASPAGDHVELLSPGALTPTGRRYTLTEVQDD